jgi:hypothetical protein
LSKSGAKQKQKTKNKTSAEARRHSKKRVVKMRKQTKNKTKKALTSDNWNITEKAKEQLFY